MAAIALGAIAAFLFLYGRAIYLTWVAAETVPSFSPEYVYVATALAGLVGGVAAMIFNEKLPDAPASQPSQAAREAVGPRATPSVFGPAAGRTAFVRAITLRGVRDPLAVVSAVYVLAYFLVGIAAIATWIKVSAATPDLIRNLALISIGLFVAIARSFFNIPKPTPG